MQYWRSKSPAIPTCTSCGQKVTPILPPEDYQALINQGVKPEDIILNLNDDTDAESDVSINDSGCNNLSNDFVFPDEATTAKLLAVNTAAKNLKRQHSSAVATAAVTGLATTSNINNTKLSRNNETTELTEFHFDFNEASTSSSAFIATAGYSTRLFYGSSNSTTGTVTTNTTTTLPHKSVIVSPQSQLNRIVNSENSKVIGNQPISGQTDCNVVANGGGSVNIATGSTSHSSSTTEALVSGGGSVCSNINNTNTIEDVNNLQAISSHETKKARRVQKTTRCLNNSSNKRK